MAAGRAIAVRSRGSAGKGEVKDWEINGEKHWELQGGRRADQLGRGWGCGDGLGGTLPLCPT